MAPLPPNNTVRLWVQYQGPAGIHEVMFRFVTGTNVADATAAAVDICTAMAVALTEDTEFNGARYSAAGSNISLPVPWTPIAGTNVDTMDESEFPNFIDWIGRDDTGHRVRWALNGIPLNPDGDYRLFGSDDAGVQAVIDALSDPDNGIVTIAEQPPVVYQYADTGRNAYFQRKRRRVS